MKNLIDPCVALYSYTIIFCSIALFVIAIIQLKQNWSKIKQPMFWIVLVLVFPLIGSLIFLFLLSKIKNKTIIVIISLCSSLLTSCVDNNNNNNLRKCYYLDREYKYLDENYNILMDSVTFNQTIHKYGFYPDRIKKHSDSITVVLMYEFEDWNETRKATFQICYNWERLCYHTWQSEKDAKGFAKSLGIIHPWRMKDFLIDETNDNPMVSVFFEDLRKKVKKESNSDYIDQLCRKDFLTYALKVNPQRIADYEKMVAERKKQREAYQKEHGEVDPSKIGVGCGKENCCQKQGK